jgi:hypothetical protein
MFIVDKSTKFSSSRVKMRSRNVEYRELHYTGQLACGAEARAWAPRAELTLYSLEIRELVSLFRTVNAPPPRGQKLTS